MKITLLLILLLLPFHSIIADEKKEHSLETYLMNSFVNGEIRNWGVVIDSLADLSVEKDFQPTLVSLEYGYMGYLIDQKNKKELKKRLVVANRRVERLIRESENHVERNNLIAIRAAYYGFELYLNWIRAPKLGPKALKKAEESIEKGQNLPWGYIQLGNIAHYSPSFLGRDYDEAERYYQKALEHFLKDYRNSFMGRWQYYDLLLKLIELYGRKGEEDAVYMHIKKLIKEDDRFQRLIDDRYRKFTKRDL